MEQNFGLEQRVSGKELMSYISELLEKNERQEMEIERGKLSVAFLKQMNNRSRLLLDAAKFEFRKATAAAPTQEPADSNADGQPSEGQ